MSRTEIRGGQIKDETIDSADIASGSIKAGEMGAQAISGQTLITEPDGIEDRLLVWDATDSSLKQSAPTNLFVTSGIALGIGTGADGPDNTLHVKSPGTTHIKIESEAGYEAALKMNAGATSTYVWTPGNTSDIRFYAGSADRVHIDNDGNVGIGTTDPDYNLHVASAAAAVVLIDGASNADAFLRFGQNGTLKSYIKQGSGGHLVMTNETADKDIIFNIKDNTISREGLRLNGNVAEVVVNEGSDSLVDFRVESNSNTHMLYVDGGNNTTGINTSTPGSGFAVNSSFSLKVAGPKTSAYSIAEDDSCVIGDCNSAAVTLTLPSATDTMLGRIYTIKRLDSGNSGGGNMLTISRNGKNIDGVAGDILLANLDALVLQCIGAAAGWIRIGSFLAPL
ncbi:MAG TPA: hypothetical protein EYQ00_05170 [Dehalococcoidia bacterium]|jgi:hypothetical protein|nr:hypothetical protein [Dehalococcoidia bacterium]